MNVGIQITNNEFDYCVDMNTGIKFSHILIMPELFLGVTDNTEKDICVAAMKTKMPGEYADGNSWYISGKNAGRLVPAGPIKDKKVIETAILILESALYAAKKALDEYRENQLVKDGMYFVSAGSFGALNRQ